MCVLIFFIKADIVGTHLNYLDKFIKAYVWVLIWIALTWPGNSDEYPQNMPQ